MSPKTLASEVVGKLEAGVVQEVSGLFQDKFNLAKEVGESEFDYLVRIIATFWRVHPSIWESYMWYLHNVAEFQEGTANKFCQAVVESIATFNDTLRHYFEPPTIEVAEVCEQPLAA